MKKNEIIEIIIAFLFAFLAGYIDAYTYLTRDTVFSTIQTGNLIRFIISLFDGQFLLIFLLPVIFFCLGSMLAFLLNKFKYYHQIILIFLFVICLSSGFCPQQEAWDIVCISALSVLGAMQFEAFHHCLNYNCTSIMCTNNMRLFSENLVQGKFKTALFYLSIIVSFAIGVVVGVIISNAIGIYALAPISSLYVVIFILWCIFIKEKDSKIKAE